MDNIILGGMLKEFVLRHDLQSEAKEEQFEKFTNYCLLKADHYDSFDFDKVGTGACMGIDGIAISIGGVLVDEVADVEQFTKVQFSAKFVFTQAKTSSSFDLGDFLKFSGTVKLFFGNDESAIPVELKKAFEIKSVIYSRAAKMSNLPTVDLCYAYTGIFQKSENQATKLIDGEIEVFRSIPYLTSEINWRVSDGDELARLYREAQNDIEKEISFQRHVALPGISGASAAYIGVVKCLDYVKLIQKENGELNKGLFFENVRDFLGEGNTVNEDIATTIRSEDERDRFAILNNGVTIVAKKVTPSGDFFKISQFQVVNGCQTSHVLFINKEALSSDMYLTVKVIETSDVDLSGQIISTTNSQSHVVKEAFATIKPYHRRLEDFFTAMRDSGYEYYYERRPHQYDHQEIRQFLIITAPSLIKSFVSVVLEQPHKVHYYYGTLLEEYNKDKFSELFSDSDYPGIYFAAHHLATKTRNAISKNPLMKDWAFHLSLLVKKQIASSLTKPSDLNDKKFFATLQKIDKDFDVAFENALKLILDMKLNVKQNRVPAITKQMLETIKEKKYLIKDNVTSEVASVSVLNLSNGNYSGLVVGIDKHRNVIKLRYGPYVVEVRRNSNASSYPIDGARVQFVVKNGTNTQSDV